jgi:hypothetical protein
MAKRMTLRHAFLILTFCVSSVLAQNAPPKGCHITETEYAGWHAVEVANAWVKLTIIPELGGRLMQVTFGGHEYLFVNEQLKGQHFSPQVSSAQRRWFNYGGDKIWPMPEGSEDERHWPGAEGEPLDSGAFRLEILRQDATCAVRLTGPPDAAIGQQYVRDIGIDSNSPVISFHAVMRNISGYPQTWSEQSVSQYNTADSRDPSQANPEFWGFTPVNPQSAYLNSYHVRTGAASSPGYAVRDGLFAVQASKAGGEVWIDSPGEWLAIVDGLSEYTMVERFRYERGMEYPGQATVIFFTTGQSQRRSPAAAPQNIVANAPPRPEIHYVEAEVNSPLVKLEPGASYAMDTQWYPVRMGSDFKTATYAGVIGRPLSAAKSADGIAVSGKFGVFFPGQLELRSYDRAGVRVRTVGLREVTPREIVDLEQTVQVPSETVRVSLHLIDPDGVDRGPLGETTVSASSPDRN